MRKLRDFKCENEHTFEKLVNDDVTVVPCKECVSMAYRQLSAPAGSGNTYHGFMSKGSKL